MGKITRRADGRYCATLTTSGKRKYVYGKTRKECEEKARKAQRQLDHGATFDGKPKTVGDLLRLWVAAIETKRKASTMQGYKQIVKNHLIPHIGHIPLDKLAPQHIQAMIDALEHTHTARSIQNYHARLRKALNFALARRWITYNPATLVELPTANKRSVQPFTLEQARALLAAVSGHPLEMLYRMAFVMGCREGELCALLWRDVEWSKMEIRITGTLRRIDGGLVRLTGAKNNASTTTAPIPAAIMQRLEQMRQPSGYIFTTKNGTPHEPRNVYRHFKSLVKYANVVLPENQRIPDSATFHTIRHSTASFLIASGAHPRMVMEHLRHSQISITMDTYGHIFDKEHRQIGDALGDMLA